LYGHLKKDLGLVLMLKILNPIPSFFILMHLPMFHKRERGRAGSRKKRGERERD
jgi:hypothetical protein